MYLFRKSGYDDEEGMMRGMTSKYLLALIFICGVFGTAYTFHYFKPCVNFNEATLQTPTQTISLALANNPEQQAKGLGACRYVPNNAGMYFQLPDVRVQAFWMKNMVIPIDIVWIRGNKVVGIAEHVPNLPLGTPDSKLPTYTSPEEVDAVLEVGAGKAQKYGIRVGTELSY